MTDKQIEQLLEVLQPSRVKGEKDRFHTLWGRKSYEGLKEVVKSIISPVDDISYLAQAFRVYDRLKKIAKQIHRQDENACNYGLTKRQETRLKKLLKEAEEYAMQLGLHAYHQGDPRGCSLYLVEKVDADTYYTNGIAII